LLWKRKPGHPPRKPGDRKPGHPLIEEAKSQEIENQDRKPGHPLIEEESQDTHLLKKQGDM